MTFFKYILTTIFLFFFLISNASIFIYKAIGNVYPIRNYKSKCLSDSVILDYPFKDINGKTVWLSDFRGRFVFIDLWYTGCGFCISANNALKEVHKDFQDENIVFLSISIDTDKKKWVASITKDAKPSKLNPWAGKYAPAKGTINLYTGGTGAKNDFVRKYVSNASYPKLLLVSPSGKLISDRPPRPDSFPIDQPEKLIAFIRDFLKSEK